MSARYEPVTDAAGWTHVVDTEQNGQVGSFGPEFSEFADEMAERLNMRELAAQVRAAAAPGRVKLLTGGSVPARPSRGDEQLVKLSNGGRVHELEWDDEPEEYSAGQVTCRPCAWFADAVDVAQGRQLFEQHVEDTAAIDARLVRAMQVRPPMVTWEHCSARDRFNEQLACEWLPRQPCACPDRDGSGHDHPVRTS